ncbi:MAG: efflux RND transporter periplasmic adaptor subunit, partial [Propionivibrio sp.]
RATLKADRAALTSGRVALDYRRITAPIAGRVGEIKVHLGSLVQPSGVDALTTITQMDPINVTFNIPERNVRALLAEQRAGSVAVEVQAGSDQLQGKLAFIDNAIDSTAGSLKARAVFDNPQAVLWPGALVDVKVVLQSLQGAIVVPPRAVQVGPAGQFVFVIGADDKVHSQPVAIIYLTSDMAVVTGLNAGDRVVVEGGQNLRPGLKVVEAKADGVEAASRGEQATAATQPGNKAAP